MQFVTEEQRIVQKQLLLDVIPKIFPDLANIINDYVSSTLKVGDEIDCNDHVFVWLEAVVLDI